MNSENVSSEAPKAHILKRLANRVWMILRYKVLPFCKRRWKLLTVLTVIIVPFLLLLIWIFAPESPEVVMATAERSDLVQTVEAVGTVISEKDLKLRFPLTGVVGKVLIEEGDSVEENQELAHLRNGALKADVTAAQASLSSQSAQLKELKEGTRPEDILIQEAEVENKKAALESAYATFNGAKEKLEKLNMEAKISLSGYVSTASSETSEQLTEIRSALRKIEDVLEDSALNRAATYNEPTDFEMLTRKKANAIHQIEQMIKLLPSNFKDYKEAISKLREVRDTTAEASQTISKMYSFVANMKLYHNYDFSDRETHKTTLTTQSNTVQDALSSLDSTLKTMRDASADYDTQIASAQSTIETSQADIQTYEASLRKQEAELAKKRAGARPTEIQAQQARVNQAYAELNRAKAKLEDTIIRAPIAGAITKVNLKEGEFTGGLDLNEFALSMLGASPYRVEMFVAEIDIPKVKLSQTGSIDLDAFPNEEFVMKVSEIDPTATDKDGVSKYRVKLDFPEQDMRLKIGMTGDAEIYTDFRKDVVHIPGRAVFTDEKGDEIVKILKDNKVIERKIKTGMEGEGGDVEVIEGINEGETIILLIKD